MLFFNCHLPYQSSSLLHHAVEAAQVRAAGRGEEWLTAAAALDLPGQFLHNVARVQVLLLHQVVANHDGHLGLALHVGGQHEEQVFDLLLELKGNLFEGVGGRQGYFFGNHRHAVVALDLLLEALPHSAGLLHLVGFYLPGQGVFLSQQVGHGLLHVLGAFEEFP